MVDTAWQRIVVLGLWLLFFAVLVIATASVVSSLSDANATKLGGWLDSHSSSIAAFLIGAVPAFGAFFFGRQSGRKLGDQRGVRVISRNRKREGDW